MREPELEVIVEGLVGKGGVYKALGNLDIALEKKFERGWGRKSVREKGKERDIEKVMPEGEKELLIYY